MADNGAKKLSKNQAKALDALLRCTTVSQAAIVAGVSARTIWRYLSNDVFKAELRKRQDQTIKATSAALVGLSGEAIQALQDLLTDPDTTPAVKARVALGWLEHTRKTVELDGLSERVRILEESLKG
jgi:phage terminase small subunit